MAQLEYSSADDYDSNDECQSTAHEHDSTTWHYQLARSLVAMYDDMHAIITGFDQLSQSREANHQQLKIKLEMMKMALILNPSDLSTWNMNELNSPYTDLRRLDDLENPLIGQTSYQHEKLRFRINRIVTKLTRGMEKLRLILSSSSDQDKSPYYFNNYRKRIEISLEEIRSQMIEYNQINKILEDDELKKHQKIISEIIKEMRSENPLIDERIEDYRMILKPNICKDKYEFFSSPLIPLQLQFDQKICKIKNKDDNNRFNIEPLEFPDLTRQAHEFFEFETSTHYTSPKTNSIN